MSGSVWRIINPVTFLFLRDLLQWQVVTGMELNSERLAVQLGLTVIYFSMFSPRNEKRRYNLNNKDKSLYSITIKSGPLN